MGEPRRMTAPTGSTGALPPAGQTRAPTPASPSPNTTSGEGDKAADDRGVAPLTPARTRLTRPAASRREIKDRARDQEADRALGERRDRPDRDPDREVRR